MTPTDPTTNGVVPGSETKPPAVTGPFPGTERLPGSDLAGKAGFRATDDPPSAADTTGLETTPAAGLQSGAAVVVYDSHSRWWRVCLAVAGILSLTGLSIATAFLREYKLSQPGITGEATASGLAGALIQPHGHPSYTLVFLVASLSIIAANIMFSASHHNPFDVRLRVAEKRVAQATKDFEKTLASCTIKYLGIEQAHLVQGELTPALLQMEQSRHRLWGFVDWAKRHGKQAGRDHDASAPPGWSPSLGPVIDQLLQSPLSTKSQRSRQEGDEP